jgi:hypothetical protein
MKRAALLVIALTLILSSLAKIHEIPITTSISTRRSTDNEIVVINSSTPSNYNYTRPQEDSIQQENRLMKAIDIKKQQQYGLEGVHCLHLLIVLCFGIGREYFKSAKKKEIVERRRRRSQKVHNAVFEYYKHRCIRSYDYKDECQERVNSLKFFIAANRKLH